MYARFLILLLISLAVAAGCGGAGDADEGVAASASPEHVARAYVQALDRRDGTRFCRVVAPYISGTYDLFTRDPDSGLHNLRGCAGFVRAFIGYIEDCCPPEFKGAQIVQTGPVERRGRLRRVTLRIALEIEDDGQRKVRRIDDQVWLARFNGGWRVARLSEVAHEASLAMPNETAEDDPAAPPDVRREQRRYEKELAASKRRAAEREATFKPTVAADECASGIEIKDPSGDVGWDGSGPRGKPPHVAGADLRAVRVQAQDGRMCVRYELDEAPRRLGLVFNHRGSLSGDDYIKVFEAELRADGKARVTSGTDEDDRPVAVPATIGRAGRFVSLVLDRGSYAVRNAGPRSKESPRFDRFLFIADVHAPVRGGLGTADTLGGRPAPDAWSYPAGRPCGYRRSC